MKRGSQSPDDILAAFVNLTLDGTELETDVPVEEKVHQDLEGTVRLLQKHLKPAPPSQEITRRIQTRLSSEWRKSGPGERTNWQARKRNRRSLILSFAAVAVIAAISTILLMPDMYNDLQGSATEISPKTTLVVLIILILGLLTWIIIHYSRRRKK